MHTVSTSNGLRDLRLALLLIAILGVTSCSRRPLTDDRLITAFRENRAVFNEVRQASYSAQPACDFKNDPEVCLPRDSQDLKTRLKQKLALPVEDIYIDRRLGDSLWIAIETSGILGISSSTRGYVYCMCALTPTSKDTLQENENGRWYKPIEDGWMIYVVN